MKTKFLKAFLFLAIAVGLMLALSPLLRPKQAEELEELEGLGQVDYLVMGDSEGWASLQPMEIWQDHGFTGYNLSRAGQRLQDFYLQLKDTLKTQHPQVLLLETDILSNSVGMIGESEGYLTTVLSQAIPFLRYHDRWEDILPDLQTEQGEGHDRNVFRGAYFNTAVQPYTGGDYTQPTDQVRHLPMTQRYFADMIVQLCRENDIQLILYSSPSPVCWSYAMHNGIVAYAEEQGLEFLDFNLMQQELGIDWNVDSLDVGDHINFSGAQKLTDYMGRYLSENTNLQDHRGQQGFENWDIDLESYLTATGQTTKE